MDPISSSIFSKESSSYKYITSTLRELHITIEAEPKVPFKLKNLIELQISHRYLYLVVGSFVSSIVIIFTQKGIEHSKVYMTLIRTHSNTKIET